MIGCRVRCKSWIGSHVVAGCFFGKLERFERDFQLCINQILKGGKIAIEDGLNICDPPHWLLPKALCPQFQSGWLAGGNRCFLRKLVSSVFTYTLHQSWEAPALQKSYLCLAVPLWSCTVYGQWPWKREMIKPSWEGILKTTRKSQRKRWSHGRVPHFSLGKVCRGILAAISSEEFPLNTFDKTDQFVVRMQLHYPGPDKTRLSISGPDHQSDSR